MAVESLIVHEGNNASQPLAWHYKIVPSSRSCRYLLLHRHFLSILKHREKMDSSTNFYFNGEGISREGFIADEVKGIIQHCIYEAAICDAVLARSAVQDFNIWMHLLTFSLRVTRNRAPSAFQALSREVIEHWLNSPHAWSRQRIMSKLFVLQYMQVSHESEDASIPTGPRSDDNKHVIQVRWQIAQDLQNALVSQLSTLMDNSWWLFTQL